MFVVERDAHNPILSPKAEHDWESAGAFNCCPVGGQDTKSPKMFLVYRAESKSRLQDGIRRSVSSIGLATGNVHGGFEERRQLIKPEESWDQFGCEDPRVTRIGKTHYIFYTALSVYPFRAEGIRVALAKADEKMNIIEKHPITPFNAKAMALFPKKIKGKFAALLTVRTDEPPAEVCYVEFERESDMWSPEFWENWKSNILSHVLPIRRTDNEQVELGAPPVLTTKGWLVIYSHIQGYFHGTRTFGIEALLLDRDNPRKIIGRTKGAFMIPEEYYEQVGQVPNVIFPSGALVNKDTLEIYYGGADTHSAVAKVNLKKLLSALTGKTELLKRGPDNPILSPRSDKAFEVHGTFNPAAVDLNGTVHLFYRAVSNENISTWGFAASKDGLCIDERSSEAVYVPRLDFEKNGCEDPRATLIGDRVVVFYTAYDGATPRVAATSIAVADVMARKWKWDMPRLITLASVSNKDAAILPSLIGGKYMIMHRLDDMICADFVDSLDWRDEPVRSCIPIIRPRFGMWDGAKVGLACPPVETKDGWLLFYHGVSHTTHYRVGVALLDRDDPTSVRARSAFPIFEPAEDYEWRGVVPGVVFPCGIVRRGDTLFIYYGAADLVVGVATAKVSDILTILGPT